MVQPKVAYIRHENFVFQLIFIHIYITYVVIKMFTPKPFSNILQDEHYLSNSDGFYRNPVNCHKGNRPNLKNLVLEQKRTLSIFQEMDNG